MEIIDLNEKYYSTYFLCFEDWSEEMRESGNHKEEWFNEFKNKGLLTR